MVLISELYSLAACMEDVTNQCTTCCSTCLLLPPRVGAVAVRCDAVCKHGWMLLLGTATLFAKLCYILEAGLSLFAHYLHLEHTIAKLLLCYASLNSNTATQTALLLQEVHRREGSPPHAPTVSTEQHHQQQQQQQGHINS